MDDIALLRRYVEENAEEALAELVRRHVNLVYQAALRQTDGDAAVAADVTQAVFTDLARKARALTGRGVLTGWLYTSTRYAALKARRTEARRRLREHEAHAMNQITMEPDNHWAEVRPVIDDALQTLDATDREAVLLRFFEERPFAEIGAALALTEDGARKRVERSLDKMATVLRRHGVVSTSAALAGALAKGATAGAPAGLAATVASSAFGAAAGGGALGGLSLAVFMSTAKSSAGTTALALATMASLAGNAWVLGSHKTASATPAASAVTAAALPVSPVETAAAALAEQDPARLRDRLRAAGVSESMTRGIVEAALRRRYQEALIAVRAGQMRTAWWRDPSMARPGRFGAAPRLPDDRSMLREMVLDPLERLFGPDPVEIAELESRFSFLPADKRSEWVSFERAYDTELSGVDDAPGAQALRLREWNTRRETLLAGLSPTERVEYDLHFSPVSTAVGERMQMIAATEQEYRAIMGAIIAQGPPGDPRARRTSEYVAREQSAMQRLVETLGYERALDYVWSGAYEYRTYARVAAQGSLPRNTAAKVLQLGAETMEHAAAIHDDPALAAGEKRAAMVALQQSVKVQLDSLLPPQLQAEIQPPGLEWYTLLGEGRYKNLPTSLAGNSGGSTTIGSSSVEVPPQGPRIRHQFVLRKPAAEGGRP